MSRRSNKQIHLDLSDEENMKPEFMPLVEIKVPTDQHASYILDKWKTLSNEDHGTVYRKIHISIGKINGYPTIRSTMVNKYSKPWFVHIVEYFVDEFNFLGAKDMVYPVGVSFYNLVCIHIRSIENSCNVRITKNNVSQRDVTIQGKEENIMKACRKINEIIEQYLSVKIEAEKQRMRNLERVLDERTQTLIEAAYTIDSFL